MALSHATLAAVLAWRQVEERQRRSVSHERVWGPVLERDAAAERVLPEATAGYDARLFLGAVCYLRARGQGW